ncbi:MAG: heavy metal translocating P-type ATPase [Lachnospiraceae bacterium]|nr:heavy metal translocating P-type ATPase [Lachnospiraceae bacterium]
MNKKQKVNLTRILTSAGLMILFYFLPIHGLIRFLLYQIPYWIVGYDVLEKAWKNIRKKKPFDEHFLMAVATLGALGLAVYETLVLKQDGDYVEAIAVMLFYQVGEWFQSYAVGKSRRNITELMDIRPDYANIDDGRGGLRKADPDDVEVGSLITVRPGEKIPIDGTVEDGTAMLDTSALTGESVPRSVHAGDSVISGCINTNGLLKIRTTKEFGESTASKILEMIEDASSRKSRSEAFITKFARVYTPIVVYAAIALALIPTFGIFLVTGRFTFITWLYRALIFLVISCPCALVISIPLSFFAGIGGASRAGVLIKGSNFLESLAETKTVVFDKTGTLTKGVFEVTAVHPEKLDEKELLHLAAHVEHFSTHPIANSLRLAYQKYGSEDDDCEVSDVREIAGKGVSAKVNGKTIYVGNSKLMDEVGAKWHDCHQTGTIIHVAIDGVYAGHIVISDVVKPHSAEAIGRLRSMHTKTVMLTGDRKAVGENVGRELGLDEVHTELLPQDKVTNIERLMQERKDPRDAVAFVGDGINDAPVLSRADVGIAMGAMGSDAAIEAADIVLMDDDPKKVCTAIGIARKCLRIVRQNIVFAIGVKILCMILGATGLAGMWIAVVGDVGVMICCVLNAIRCLSVKEFL